MTRGTVVTGALYRTQRGHGKGFADQPPPVIAPVHRPARVAIMLALAHKIAGAIADGQLQDQAEAARRLGVTRARITQLLGLLTLAPDLQEQVLALEAIDGLEPVSERALRVATCELSWAAQRAICRRLLPTAARARSTGAP